jgi:hypothetical protein
MKNRLLSIFALLALLTIGACSDDEPKAKSITDADGVVITLTWITDGTPAQALEDADLDIFAISTTELLGSSSGSEFEEFEINGTHDDGEFTLTVDLFENTAGKAVDYIVTISGGGKEYEFDGDFAADAADGDFDTVLTVTKAGDKYTIND